jgi:hypothetical protein
MPAIPAPGRLRQEDQEFETSLAYIVKLHHKKQKQQQKQSSFKKHSLHSRSEQENMKLQSQAEQDWMSCKTHEPFYLEPGEKQASINWKDDLFLFKHLQIIFSLFIHVY